MQAAQSAFVQPQAAAASKLGPDTVTGVTQTPAVPQVTTPQGTEGAAAQASPQSQAAVDEFIQHLSAIVPSLPQGANGAPSVRPANTVRGSDDDGGCADDADDADDAGGSQGSSSDDTKGAREELQQIASQLASIAGQMETATDPAQIQALTGQLQALIGRLVALLGRLNQSGDDAEKSHGGGGHGGGHGGGKAGKHAGGKHGGGSSGGGGGAGAASAGGGGGNEQLKRQVTEMLQKATQMLARLELKLGEVRAGQ